ncbi:MAG: hypothetical protein KCHDKBKB_03119 [Elusimicrobia bacterium]|nr:hypothetical protein [Elusimicrobiota bacterium]
MSIQTSIIQIKQSGIARALAPIVMPAREIFREPADMLSVQQADWAPALADRIGALIAPGWAASQYANEVLRMLQEVGKQLEVQNIIEQIVGLAPQFLRQGIDVAGQIIGAAISMTPIIGSLIGLLFDWIMAIFGDGPSQEDWNKFFDAFKELRKKITGFEVYATEAIRRHIAFVKIIEPAFRLAPAAAMTTMMFDRPGGKPQPFPSDERPFFRVMTYHFGQYRILIPGKFSTETGFIDNGFSLALPGFVPGGVRNDVFFARSLKELSRPAIAYPGTELERYVIVPWWREMWENTSRFNALKHIFNEYPAEVDSSLWNGLRNSVHIMNSWSSDPMGSLRARIEENITRETRDAQRVIEKKLGDALNNLGDAEAMFVHTPDEAQVYRSRDGSAPYPGRKLVIVPRGSLRPPENPVALHWTSRNFDFYRGAAADNIIRGANRAAAQSARKTGDSRGGAALLALAAAGALIYANSRD